jgi:hypothetical protein
MDGLIGFLGQALAWRLRLPKGQHMALKKLIVGLGVCRAGSSVHNEWRTRVHAHLQSTHKAGYPEDSLTKACMADSCLQGHQRSLLLQALGHSPERALNRPEIALKYSKSDLKLL